MNILILIIILISIPFILAVFLSNEYLIEREITINRPRHEVFDYIKFLRHAERFNKWVMMDPDMKKEFRGTDGTEGFVYAWDSNNKQVGKGEQEIRNISAGERIDYEIRFMKPFEKVSYAHITTTTVSENQTKVKWAFSGMRNYPMKIMHLLLNLKKILGNDLQTSLGNLKNVIETAS